MESYMRGASQRRALYWNSIASILNSFQSAVLLIIISHAGGRRDAGIFTFAYAAANLMAVIGKFGMRHFQVSDAINKYSFSDYLFSRRITTTVMIVVSGIYVFVSGMGDSLKIAVVLSWCGIRAVESYEDIYHGFLHKNGFLDKAAKVLSVRTLLDIIAFSLTYYLSTDLLLASLVSLFTALSLSIILNSKYRSLFPRPGEAAISQVRNLLIENLSLFVGNFCTMYLSNAPKYTMNNILSSEIQAVYGYMFMPVFLINMLCNFILQPLLTTYTAMWHSKNIREIWRLMCRHICIILSLTGMAILGGKVIGIYLLEIIYNVSLKPYSHIVYILLVASGLIAAMSYFRALLTVLRYQNIVLAGYLAACAAMIIGGRFVLQTGGMVGISVYYTVILLLLDVFSFFLLMYALNKGRRSCEDKQ